MDVTPTSWVQVRGAYAFPGLHTAKRHAPPALDPTTRVQDGAHAQKIDGLVAGDVPPHKAASTLAHTEQREGATLALHQRVADQNEAAVGVAKGRLIDVRA